MGHHRFTAESLRAPTKATARGAFPRRSAFCFRCVAKLQHIAKSSIAATDYGSPQLTHRRIATSLAEARRLTEARSRTTLAPHLTGGMGSSAAHGSERRSLFDRLRIFDRRRTCATRPLTRAPAAR